MRSITSHAAKSGVGEHTARESESAKRVCRERASGDRPPPFLAPGPYGSGAKLCMDLAMRAHTPAVVRKRGRRRVLPPVSGGSHRSHSTYSLLPGPVCQSSGWFGVCGCQSDHSRSGPPVCVPLLGHSAGHLGFASVLLAYGSWSVHDGHLFQNFWPK